MPIARQTLLVAEDDPAIADMIAECLADEGYEVTVVPSVAATVAALRDREFALVLTDAFANQGVGAGRWLGLEQIRRAAGASPLILCTAHRTQDFADFAAHGFAAILNKPFDLDHFIALIAHLIAQSDATLSAEEAGPRRSIPSRKTGTRC